MSAQIKLTLRTTGKRIAYLIENNKMLAAQGKLPVALNIEGPAGVGKTSIVKQKALESGMTFIRLDLGSITIDDLIGMPLKQVELCTPDKESCIWVNEREVDHYFNNGYTPTNNTRTTYALPQWFKCVEQTQPVVLYLDDFTRAPQQVIQACMPIIDEQRFNTFSLPLGSTVILSSNPEVDDSGVFYSVTALDSAQNTRYLTLSAKFDLDEWVEDFGEMNVDSRLINFFLTNPEIINGVGQSQIDGKTIKKAPIRLWTKFADAISGIQQFDDSESLEMINDLGSCFPTEHIVLFTQFINNKLDRIPTPRHILADPKAHETLEKLILNNGKTNSSIASIIQKRICAFLLNFHEELNSNEIDKLVDLLFAKQYNLFTKDLIHIAATKLVKVKSIMKNQNFMKVVTEQYKS